MYVIKIPNVFAIQLVFMSSWWLFLPLWKNCVYTTENFVHSKKGKYIGIILRSLFVI